MLVSDMLEIRPSLIRTWWAKTYPLAAPVEDTVVVAAAAMPTNRKAWWEEY